MKLIFKQRFFSWFDSYDIYNEEGQTVYTVEGKLALGHCLDILDATGQPLGRVKEEIFTFLPRFCLYFGDTLIGQIRKELTLFKPSFTLDCNGWHVDGDFWEWDYDITDDAGVLVAHISKEVLHWTDTYVLNILDPNHALMVLMIALAIDATKCSDGNS